MLVLLYLYEIISNSINIELLVFVLILNREMRHGTGGEAACVSISVCNMYEMISNSIDIESLVFVSILNREMGQHVLV